MANNPRILLMIERDTARRALTADEKPVTDEPSGETPSKATDKPAAPAKPKPQDSLGGLSRKLPRVKQKATSKPTGKPAAKR